jgi:hypothetical protein
MSEFSAELGVIQRYADALLIGKVVGENGIMTGAIENKTEDGSLPIPDGLSREVAVQSKVSDEGIQEYYLSTSDGYWLEGMGTKRVIFDMNHDVSWTQKGGALLGVGYHKGITETEERHTHLQAMIKQLGLDMPDVSVPQFMS